MGHNLGEFFYQPKAFILEIAFLASLKIENKTDLDPVDRAIITKTENGSIEYKC